MSRIILVFIISALIIPSLTSEALAKCDKVQLIGAWVRLNINDPPLKTPTIWTFIPSAVGADYGSIKCTGDCERTYGPPVSYELNQPTMMSRMKVKFKKGKSIYYCKVEGNSLILGPMKFSR